VRRLPSRFGGPWLLRGVPALPRRADIYGNVFLDDVSNLNTNFHDPAIAIGNNVYADFIGLNYGNLLATMELITNVTQELLDFTPVFASRVLEINVDLGHLDLEIAAEGTTALLLVLLEHDAHAPQHYSLHRLYSRVRVTRDDTRRIEYEKSDIEVKGSGRECA